MDTKRIPVSEDPFYATRQDSDEGRCGCNAGWVSIGQLVVDEETGEEVEEFALYLCRRCSGDNR